MSTGQRTFALAQFPVSDEHDANLETGRELAVAAAQDGAAFVGYTELAFRPFFPRHRADSSYFAWAEPLDGRTVTAFQSLAEHEQIACAVNFFERAGRGRFFDTTVICAPDGRRLGPIRMAHAAEEPGYNEKYYYWPGDTPPQVVEVAGVNVGVAICYDRHFPEYTRALVLQGADVVFCPFAGLATDPLDLYEIEMRAFAFQHQVYVLCVNRVGREGEAVFAGRSFAVGPDGEIIARAASEGKELLRVPIDTAQIEHYRVQRPFLRDRRPRFYREFYP